MIPPPAPARPLISASDISPCSYYPIPAAPFSSPLRRPADHSGEPSKTGLHAAPQRVASAACFSVSLDCGRRKRGRGGGVGVVEWTRLGSRLGAPTGVPRLPCSLFVKSSDQKTAAACRVVCLAV